jgi:hypothetical protein
MTHSRHEVLHFRQESERLFGEIEKKTGEFAAERHRLGNEFTAEKQRLGNEFTAEKQRLGNEFTAEKQRLEAEFSAERHRLENELARLENELRCVYASRSWRLTRPVRAIGTGARRVRALLLSAPSRLRGLAKRLAQGVLGGAMAYFRARPGQKQLLIRLVSLVPGLSAKLQQIAARRAMAELLPSPSPDVTDPDPANQPASVRRVYARLSEARTRSQASATKGTP